MTMGKAEMHVLLSPGAAAAVANVKKLHYFKNH